MRRREFLAALGAIAASVVVSRVPKLQRASVEVLDHHAKPFLTNGGWRVHMFVHDEITIEVPTADASRAFAMIQREWDEALHKMSAKLYVPPAMLRVDPRTT